MNTLGKLRLMVARGVVNLINDAGGLQVLQISARADETIDDVERAQNFGMSSHPPIGSTPILVAVGGAQDHMVAVAVDNEKHRPKGLQEGETALYNAHGVLFLFDKDGHAKLKCKSFQVEADESTDFKTPMVSASAQVTAMGQINGNGGMAVKGGSGVSMTGNVTHADGQLISNGVSVDRHKHSGVTIGGAMTGLPT